MFAKVPRVETGDPYCDFVMALCAMTLFDYVYGNYSHHKSAEYFLTTNETEFDGVDPDYYFDIIGLNRQYCYKKVRILRKDTYGGRKLPIIIRKPFILREPCVRPF